MTPVVWQRVESVAVAAVVLFASALLDLWWFPLAVFLAWDLSALGYVVNTRVGATLYNAIHSYVGPVALAAWVAVAGVDGNGRWVLLIALAWTFHVAVDRALGYGLKHADSFQHTHLGWIGKHAKHSDPAE
jgi:hypothetical protein